MDDPRRAEVLRLLDRYLVEIVEANDFCPWAKAARRNGEIGRAVLFGEPTIEAWTTAASALLADPEVRVAMVVAPEFPGSLADLRDVRSILAAKLTNAGIAEFHPDADLDLGSPGRLVRFVRRSPDPMIQLVPIAILDSVRTGDRRVIDRHELAAVLSGAPLAVEVDIGETIAAANFATVGRDPGAVTATLDAIAADRRAAYARVGIDISTSR